MHNKQLLADFSLLMVAAVWGATFVTVKNALADMTPFYFNAVRFSLAALLLLMLSGRRLWRLDRRLIRAGVIIGIFLFAGYTFQTIGLQYTSASNTGFITGLSVVMVPFFAMMITGIRPPRWAVIGAVLAAIGLALLSLDASLNLNIGDLLVFLCAISFALHIIFVGRYAPLHDVILLVTVQVATVALLSAVGAFLREPLPPAPTAQVWWALAITSLLATVVAFLVQNAMQKFTTTTRTAIIFSMEPVFGAIFAYLWLHEIMTPQDWLGSMLVLAGMLAAEIPPVRLKHPNARRAETEK